MPANFKITTTETNFLSYLNIFVTQIRLVRNEKRHDSKESIVDDFVGRIHSHLFFISLKVDGITKFSIQMSF